MTMGTGTYGAKEVETAKSELRAQITVWRTAGWSWYKIKSGEGAHVWKAYVALGGK